MTRRTKRTEPEGDFVQPYYSALDGMELPRTFRDDEGMSHRLYDEDEAVTILTRIIDGKEIGGDALAFRAIELGAEHYSDNVNALASQASMALILGLPGARDWLARVAAEGLDAVKEADRQAAQNEQAADEPQTEDQLWAARFRQGTEIVKSCGEGASKRVVVEAMLRGGFFPGEIVKIFGCNHQHIYPVRDKIAAEYLRKQQAVPENLKVRRRSQYKAITSDMDPRFRKAAMDKNLLLASDAGQAARAIPDPNRKKKKAFGVGAGLEHIKWDEGRDE